MLIRLQPIPTETPERLTVQTGSIGPEYIANSCILELVEDGHIAWLVSTKPCGKGHFRRHYASHWDLSALTKAAPHWRHHPDLMRDQLRTTPSACGCGGEVLE